MGKWDTRQVGKPVTNTPHAHARVKGTSILFVTLSFADLRRVTFGWKIGYNFNSKK